MQRRRSIGLTPLIDIVFLLLIFFMLASNFIKPHTIVLADNSGTNTEQKITSKGSAATQWQGSVLIRLHNNGKIDINGRPTSLENLANETKQLLSATPSLKIFLQPANNIPLQKLVNILDDMRSADITDIHLIQP